MPSAALSLEKLSEVKRLYYSEKLGATVVAKKLGVSANAVYSFMRRNQLPVRSLFEESRIRFERKAPSFNLRSKLSTRDQNLKIAGTMLYWAEGYQSDIAIGVDFANSKPEMMSLFIRFLRRICGVDETRIRCYLYCYANQNVEELIEFWGGLLKIPRSSFTKPYVRTDYRADKIDKMKYGLLHIRYSDKKLLDLIRSWIGEYSRSL